MLGLRHGLIELDPGLGLRLDLSLALSARRAASPCILCEGCLLQLANARLLCGSSSHLRVLFLTCSLAVFVIGRT